jgi:hypothetical protein
LHIENTSGHAINEETGCKERITPKAKRNGRMSKKSEPCFYDMTMFTLSGAILLMSVRTSNTVNDTEFMKKGIEVAILAPPI